MKETRRLSAQTRFELSNFICYAQLQDQVTRKTSENLDEMPLGI